ncbi:MAG: TetR/AcrR family transcriptional regulator [Candidatus Hydrogenedentota bacterium]
MAITTTKYPDSAVKPETRERLLSAAITLFAEKGYDATSIREIIDAAGVTRPALYYYFENKEALFTHLVQQQFALATAEIDQIFISIADCPQRLRALAKTVFKRAKSSPEMLRILLNFFFAPTIDEMRLDKEALGRERFDRIVAIMREGVASGEVRGQPEALALAFSALVDMHVMATIYDESVLTDELADALVDLFLHGAAPTQKRKK